MDKKNPRKRIRMFRVWLRISALAAQSQLLTSWAGFLFLIGKIIRFILFFVFLFSVLAGTKQLAGFSREQVIFFFLVFNLVDIIPQFLFRGTYRFRSLVVKGEFDLDLLKPWPSYFRPIFGWSDFLDFLTLIPLLGYLFYYASANHLASGVQGLILFVLLLINAVIISFSFHLVVSAVCIMTLEIDHLILVYRDLTSMARFPTDIYPQMVQYLLTFTIPVVLMFTVPAKTIMGLLSWHWVAVSFLLGIIFLFFSLNFWKYSLKRYTSASS